MTLVEKILMSAVMNHDYHDLTGATCSQKGPGLAGFSNWFEKGKPR